MGPRTLSKSWSRSVYARLHPQLFSLLLELSAHERDSHGNSFWGLTFWVLMRTLAVLSCLLLSNRGSLWLLWRFCCSTNQILVEGRESQTLTQNFPRYYYVRLFSAFLTRYKSVCQEELYVNPQKNKNQRITKQAKGEIPFFVDLAKFEQSRDH